VKKLFVAFVGVVLLAPYVRVAGQSKSGSLQGVWQTVEITIAGPSPRTITIPEPRPYFTIITPRYYSRTEVQAEGPRPILPDVAKATADELRTVWGPFVGEAGTYEVSGGMMTVHPLASKNPAAMVPGAFIVYSYRLEGDTLWLTQQRNQGGPYPSPATFKDVRVE
jgi:hypothetical protein